MASLRKKPNSACWYACFTDATGDRVQCSTGIEDRGSQSERAKARRQALEVAQTYEDVARGQKTEAQIRQTIARLAERVNGKRMEFARTENFLRDWLARVGRMKSGGTFTRYENVIAAFLESLGERRTVLLADITPEDVQRFIDGVLAQRKSPQTVKMAAKILNAPFAHAARRSLIVSNPVPAAEIPNGASETRHPFNAAHVAAIFRTAQGEWKTASYLGAYLGARLGDCISLAWRDVDLASKLIRYRPQKTARHKKDVVVPLHPDLERHLLSLKPGDDATALLTPTLGTTKISGRSGLSRQFLAIVTAAGIENEAVAPGTSRLRAFNRFGFHSFRHTFKTELVNAGVPIEVADVLQGHAKKTVSETYIHRTPEILRAAVLKLPDFSRRAA